MKASLKYEITFSNNESEEASMILTDNEAQKVIDFINALRSSNEVFVCDTAL